MKRRHVSWEALLEAARSGETAPPTIREHLEACPRCAALAREAALLIGALEISQEPGPSKRLLEKTWAALLRGGETAETDERAERRGRQPARRIVERLRSRVGDLWAIPVADSLRASPALRGGPLTTDEPRVVVFDAGPFGVSISLGRAASGRGADITGQVFPNEAPTIPPGGRVTLSVGDAISPGGTPPAQGTREVPLGEHGEFRLEGVPLGVVAELAIEIAGSCIRVGPLTLGRDR